MSTPTCRHLAATATQLVDPMLTDLDPGYRQVEDLAAFNPDGLCAIKVTVTPRAAHKEMINSVRTNGR